MTQGAHVKLDNIYGNNGYGYFISVFDHSTLKATNCFEGALRYKRGGLVIHGNDCKVKVVNCDFGKIDVEPNGEYPQKIKFVNVDADLLEMFLPAGSRFQCSNSDFKDLVLLNRGDMMFGHCALGSCYVKQVGQTKFNDNTFYDMLRFDWKDRPDQVMSCIGNTFQGTYGIYMGADYLERNNHVILNSNNFFNKQIAIIANRGGQLLAKNNLIKAKYAYRPRWGKNRHYEWILDGNTTACEYYWYSEQDHLKNKVVHVNTYVGVGHNKFDTRRGMHLTFPNYYVGYRIIHADRSPDSYDNALQNDIWIHTLSQEKFRCVRGGYKDERTEWIEISSV